MLCECDLRKGIVYIPTLGKVPGGPYRGMEPVAVVPVSNTAALRHALGEALTRGNPTVPRLLRANRPEPVMPKHAGVKTWAAFERGTSFWWLREDEGLYNITGLKRGRYGGQVPDHDREEDFPAGTSVETVIDRMIAILQSAHER